MSEKTVYYFKVEYRFMLPGKIRIKPDADGIWQTTDPERAAQVAKCHGVHPVSAERVAGLQAMRQHAQRYDPARDDAPATVTATAAVPPVVSTLDPPSGTIEGDEVGDVLDDEPEGELQADPQGEPEDEPEGEEMIKAEDIGQMTKAELRELLDEWEVDQPPNDAKLIDLKTAALAALPGIDG